MKDRLRKKIAACICAAFVLAGTGCNSKKNVTKEPVLITADSLWYDSVEVIVDSDINKVEYEQIDTKILGVAGDKILAYIDGHRYHDPDDTGEYSSSFLRIYDMEGNLTDDIDLEAKLSEYRDPDGTDPGIQFVYNTNPQIRGDKFYLRAFSMAYQTDVELCFDIESRQFISYDREAENWFFLDNITVEGYTVETRLGYGTSHYVDIRSPQGDLISLDLDRELADIRPVFSLGRFIYLGEGKLLSDAVHTDLSTEPVMIDIINGTISSLTGDSSYDWISDLDIGSVTYLDGFGNVAVDSYGVNLINTDTHEMERIFRFENCNANIVDIKSLNLIYMDDERMVFAGPVMRGDIFNSVMSLDQGFIILDKADTNPNAGKTLLTAAYLPGSLSYPTAEAIRLFNEQSGDSMIVIDQRYTLETLGDQITHDPGETAEEYNLKVDSAVITALSIDLMAGEGPDLIFGFIHNTQLDSPDLLMDLKDCIDGEECFANVIDAAKTGDALYQVPLCFSVNGIITSSDNVPSGAVGFTFEQYLDFIHGPCNGNEPTRLGKVAFLNLCLQQMSDAFSSSGGYEFDNEAFRDLVEFTNETIFEPEEEEFDIYSAAYSFQIENTYDNVTSASQMIMEMRGPIDGYRLMGVASEDGRGPLAYVLDSVAVSAATSSPAACLRFVRMLTGRESQEAYARTGFSINRAAFTSEAYQTVQDTNYRYDNYYSLYFTVQKMREWGVPTERLDEDAFVNTLLFYVDSISGIGYMDAPVQMIVSEEIQAYFAGQKTLDEVIGIIDDRVATYVNERQT
ncbi:MAG: hypothetical protein J5685_05025 [Clostridiales bacterium]|nr:hypothetical protein [Clostridiales bacterium]